MAEKTEKTSEKLLIGKIFGILSIVFAFLSEGGFGGIILGIIGLVQLKGIKKGEAKKSRRLNIIGIVIGGILFVVYIIMIITMIAKGELNLLISE